MLPRKSPLGSPLSSNSVLSKVRSMEQVSVSPFRLSHVMAPPNTALTLPLSGSISSPMNQASAVYWTFGFPFRVSVSPPTAASQSVGTIVALALTHIESPFAPRS